MPTPAPKTAPQHAAKAARSRVLPPCRVTESERSQITLRAAEAGLSVSAFLRASALETAIVKREAIADKQLLRELSAIGNNLNQIAREVNIHGEICPRLVQRLNEALERNAALMDGLIDGA